MLLISRTRALMETVCWHLAALPDSGVLMWTDVDAPPTENLIGFAEAADGRCAVMPLAATAEDEAYLTEYFEKEIANGSLQILTEWPSDWAAKVVTV